jgi:prephenate dehydrogenase
MRIGIIGFGKMGQWFSNALCTKHEVAVFDLNPERIMKAKNVKVLKKQEELGFFEPELLINAVSLKNTLNVFKEIEKVVQKECILCDVASIKNGFNEFCQKTGFKFVSVHPMFGPGVTKNEDLEKENAIIISESCERGKKFFRDFFGSLKVNVFECSFAEHDKMMAYSLTLPFFSSMVFAGCVKEGTVPGTTFAKHKKIAKGVLAEDDSLLTEVFFNTASVEQIEKITSQLEFLKHVINSRDEEEMKKVLGKLKKNIQ